MMNNDVPREILLSLLSLLLFITRLWGIRGGGTDCFAVEKSSKRRVEGWSEVVGRR